MNEGFKAIMFRDKLLVVGSGWIDSIISEDNTESGGVLCITFKSDYSLPITPQLRELKHNYEESWDKIRAIVVSKEDWVRYEGELWHQQDARL